MRLLLLFAVVLVGCASDEPQTPPDAGDLALSAEERAEIDASLDSARTMAADSAVVRGVAGGGVGRDWPAPDALHYTMYRNAAHGYRFDYPDNLLEWGEAIGGDRGQSFESTDGSAVLLVYATDADEPGELRRQYELELGRDDQEVTYRVLKPNWFVISGHDGPYIFYQRTFRLGDGLRTFRLRHLAEDKDYFVPVTERLSFSFSEQAKNP